MINSQNSIIVIMGATDRERNAQANPPISTLHAACRRAAFRAAPKSS